MWAKATARFFSRWPRNWRQSKRLLSGNSDYWCRTPPPSSPRLLFPCFPQCPSPMLAGVSVAVRRHSLVMGSAPSARESMADGGEGPIDVAVTRVAWACRMKAALPSNEPERLQTVFPNTILDKPSEECFDDITRLAAEVCSTPIALISLIDTNHNCFKSVVGWDIKEVPRDADFWDLTILENDIFVIPDASKDERFASGPYVTSHPKIRFYAGAPLLTAEGEVLGTLCVIDQVPRELSPNQNNALR